MSENRIGRRAMVKRTLHLAVLAGAAPTVLAACGGGGELACTDDSQLSEADRTARRGSQYADRTTDPSRACERCTFYQAAAANQCGTCTVVRGPINPQGTCQLFAPRA